MEFLGPSETPDNLGKVYLGPHLREPWKGVFSRGSEMVGSHRNYIRNGIWNETEKKQRMEKE